MNVRMMYHILTLLVAIAAMTMPAILRPESVLASEYKVDWQVPPQQLANFSNPSGVAVDLSGIVYVADTGNHRIQKLNYLGAPVAAWGSPGSEIGQFNNPTGVAVDWSGNVYVADTGNNRIQKLDPSGTAMAVWGGLGSSDGQFNGPTGVAVDRGGNLYVADTGNNRIQKLDPSGAVVAILGSQGSGDGQFNSPNGVAVDWDGNLYVADTGNNRIQKLDPSGTFLTAWGSQGSGPGQFNSPNSVAVDSGGNLYVADTGNNRIQKLDPSGTFLIAWGSQGSGSGQFSAPRGVVVDWFGNPFVADTGNQRIQKFYFVHTLTARAAGGGSGSVSTSAGTIAFTYPTTNTGSAQVGTGYVVTLTAAATVGSSASWSGACHNVNGNGSALATCTIYFFGADTLVTATFTPMVPVTIQSAPSGRNVVVDGTSYTTPYSFTWPAGSQHLIAAPTPQTVEGARYTFNTWSDGGAASHTVTIPGTATVYTANFFSEYQLNLIVNPAAAGVVSPITGTWYASGTIVPVEVILNKDYAFSSWSGPVASTTTKKTTVTMAGPTTVTANLIGIPHLNAAIGANKTGAANARLWPITLTNTGTGAAQVARISSLKLSQTSGEACRPAIKTPLPTFGNIDSGASATGSVTIDFSRCASKARFTATVTYSAANGGSCTEMFINQLR